jgi:predicted phosphodiesterase
MRILHVTDFHAHEPWFKWLATQAPACDIICYTGDFLDLFSPVLMATQIRLVTYWLAALKQPMVFCSGNHDIGMGPRRDGAWLRGLLSPIRKGDGSAFARNGVSFASCSWGTPCHLTHPVTVLLTHAPPGGCATAISGTNGVDWGDFDLGEDLRAGLIAADIVLSGHMHEPRAWHDRVGTSLSFNPGCAARDRLPNYILLDLDQRQARLFTDGHATQECRW